MKKYLLLFLFVFTNICLSIACDLTNYNKFVNEGNISLQNKDYIGAIILFKKAYQQCFFKGIEVDYLVLNALKTVESEGKDLEEIYFSFKRKMPQEKMFYTFDFEFYENKYALVKFNKKYQFIDSIGRKINKLQDWKKATHFYVDGFTEVVKNNNTYLLDTLGNLHLYTDEIGNLTPETRVLDIGYWELSNIPKDVFENKQLNILDFSDNAIVDIPDDIYKIDNLKILIAYKNKISKISDNLDKLQQLENIELSDNSLKYMPQSIFKLKKLKYLLLDGNSIKEIPKDIKNLEKIVELDLSENKVTNIPTELYQLKSLKDLWLSSNKIKEISEDIEQLENLFSLDFRDNQIEFLPNNITKIKKLNFIDLSYNKIKTLPQSIANMKGLRKLYLVGNPIGNEEKDRIRKALPNCIISFEDKIDEIKKLAENKKFIEAYNLSLDMVKDDSTDYHRWYDLSWRALFANKPEMSIQAANKTLTLRYQSETVITNLVLGYLLSNQWDKAKNIYEYWKNKKFQEDKRLPKDIFLKDIETLEKEGIKHPDLIKAKQLLLLFPSEH